VVYVREDATVIRLRGRESADALLLLAIWKYGRR
jgi:hypothetical protein